MPERTRKLHVDLSRNPVSGNRLRVRLCHYDDSGQGEELVSSKEDGTLAVEMFRASVAAAAHWRVVADRELGHVDPNGPGWWSDVARCAWYALAEPDVGAIHVVAEGGPSDLGILGGARTFIRDRADWLDVPRYPHPVYSVAPRASVR